jgi:hypothetical protein
MTVPVVLHDPESNISALVNEFGQLVVGNLEFSVTGQKDIIDASAQNLAAPAPGRSIILTGIVYSSDKNVGVDGAIVEIYTADSPTSTTVITEIFKLNVLRNGGDSILPLSILIDEGLYLNTKSDEFSISVTAAYYRAPRKRDP